MVKSARTGKFLPKDRLGDFVTGLMSQGELYAPKREDEISRIEPISSPKEISSDFMQTINNLRTIVEPQNEIILNFKDSVNPTIEERLPSEKRKIIMWCRPCDARALTTLDDNFIDEDFPDPYYIRRRRAAILIGLGCNEPFPFCFCVSVGGDPFSIQNLDILMTEMVDGYYLEILTEAGGQLLDDLPEEVLRVATEEQEKRLDEIKGRAKKSISRIAPEPVEVVEKLEKAFDAPYWKKWGDKCIGCGICTLLCPTCWCFDITDLETRGKGYRIRTWDSCQFPLFTLHSSGHNPRPDKGSRVRQRVMHKYRYHPTNYKGRIGCVGCGRCTELCPEDIDLISILNDIIGFGDE